MKKRIVFSSLVLAIATGLLAGCGSASGTIGGNPSPAPTPSTVTCPNQIQIGAGSQATYICTTNVAGPLSVNNTMLATISTSGALTPNQTTTGPITVTATPTGTGTSASATVQVVDQIIYSTPLATGQVELINSTGGTPTQLVTGCVNPEWLSDHIRFLCIAVSGSQLLIYKTDGTASGTTLTATLSWTNLGQVDVASPSPDGTTLVFKAYDTTVKQFGVYQANVDGTNLQLLSQEAACPGSCVAIGQPRYSYDGTKVVYNHVVNGVSQICTMSTSGTNKTCLTPGTDGAFNTIGTEIFFTVNGGVYSIGSSGGQVSGVIVAGADNAMSSPNGLKLLYGNTSGISTSAIDGSGQQTLVGGGAGHGSW